MTTIDETINVKLIGRFIEDFTPGSKTAKAKEGTRVKIDRIRSQGCRSGIMCRVINVWTRPQWFDAGWFEFDK